MNITDKTRESNVQSHEKKPCVDDAFIMREGSRWEFGTSKVRRVVVLEDGKFLLKSFKNLISGLEFAPQGAGSEEFAFSIGENHRVSSASGEWKLIGSKETTQKQGERQLDVTVEQNGVQITKSYMIYPGSSIIREWIAFTNVGNAPVQIVEPTFLDLTSKIGDLPSLDFHWMTGGACFPGSWKLVTESLHPEKIIAFDSYAPYPYDGIRGHDGFPGDGVNVKVLLNDTQLWPTSGWQCTANALTQVNMDVNVDVKVGDKLVFLVNANKNDRYDTTDFDPTISYMDGESHVASQEFSDKQGTNGWQYQGRDAKGNVVDLAYSAVDKQWQRQLEEAIGLDRNLFIGAGKQCPKAGMDAALAWTSTKAGHIRISGSICNIGNTKNAGHGPKPGTANYAPWYALYNRQIKEGLFIGWDYFGHWESSLAPQLNGAINVALRVAGHKKTLAPGESFVTPKAFVGLYRDDLDNAGNECLDWQYCYMWDYTRDGWFPAVRMLGYWAKGTGYWRDAIGVNSGSEGWLGGRSGSGERLPQGLSCHRSDPALWRGCLPPGLGMVGLRGRLEQPRFSNDRQLSA